jgi:HPt (histidine-containing phosphotransfer) domain-containing protein
MCTSVLVRVGEAESFLTSRHQISEEQFDTMIRHVHSVVGGAAMLGLEKLSNTARDLKRTMHQAKETSIVSEVTT